MSWWHYLLLVNIYLVLFYIFYALLLRNETFFQLNRIYLVAAAALSFFIPMIQSDWVQNLFITQQVQSTIYSYPVMAYRFNPVQDSYISASQLLAIAYLSGILFLAARFMWQLIALKREINNPKHDAPYSFFKKISLGQDAATNGVIAAHEQVHASQWHSADVLMMEAVMIINWFNPIVYLYRFAIKHIHEYIADQEAVKTGTNKVDYAMLLLSRTFNTPAHQLVNPFFNQSLLKKRISMLQKNKSQRLALIKYGLSAPLFIVMLVLSSATVSNSKAINIINKKAQMVFLTFSEQDGKLNGKPFKKIVFEQSENTVAGKTAALRTILVQAGKDTLPVKDTKVFTSVEHVPEFPGGIDAFFNFLAKNIRYPAESRQKGKQGRVIISFIVEKDGALTGLKVMRGVDAQIDEEALRVLKLSPNWEPGIQNGKTVRVAYTVPISFTLADDGPAKPRGNKSGAVNEDKKSSATFIVLNENEKQQGDTAKKAFTIHLDEAYDGKASLHPLYLLDGKQIDNLSSVNPGDIESISVLKDKEATATYGSRGVNGVVIIKTKLTRLKLKSPAKQ
jgi:TonB family protein